MINFAKHEHAYCKYIALYTYIMIVCVSQICLKCVKVSKFNCVYALIIFNYMLELRAMPYNFLKKILYKRTNMINYSKY